MFFLPLFDDNPISKKPFVTYALIILNCIVFLIQTSFSTSDLNLYFLQNGFVPDHFFASPSPFYLQLYSSIFIHAGFLHLASNMLYLWIFGDNVEAKLGPIKFLFFYLICGVIASIGQGLIDTNSNIPLVGASGSIAGVLGAYFLLYPKANVRVLFWFFIFIQIINVPAFIVLGVWIVGQFISAGNSLETGVAYFAHIAGFIAGFILMLILKNRDTSIFNKPVSEPFSKSTFKDAYKSKIYDQRRSAQIKKYD